MNKLLNNLLGMYKQAKLNKKAEEVVYDSDLIAQVLSMTKNQKEDEFSIATLSPEKDKVLGVKYIKKDEVYDYKPNQNEYALVGVRDTGFIDTDYQLQPMIMVVRSWNEGRKFYATKKNRLNKKAEEKEAAKKDYTEQYAKVKEIMKEYGYGLSDGGYIYLISKEEPKDEGFQVKFKGDRLRVELDGKLKYSGYGPEAIEDFLKGMFYAKKLSSKAKAMRKRADLKSNIEEFDKAWEKHEENFFKDYEQTLLTEYKGNLTKATQDLINSFERELPKETLYKLLKEYIDRPSFEKIEEKDLQEAQQLVENFNKTNNEYEKNKKTIEQKIEQRLRNFYEMGYRDYKNDQDPIQENDSYWGNYTEEEKQAYYDGVEAAKSGTTQHKYNAFYWKTQSSKNTKLTKKAGWKVLTPKDLTEEVKDEFLKDSIKEYAGHVKREDFYFVKGIKEKEDDQFSYEWEEGMFGEWRTNVKGEKWYSLTDLGDDWDYIYLIKEDKLYKMPNRESLTDFGVVSSKRVKLTKKADYTKEEIEMINKEKEKQIECGEMIWKAKNALYGNKVQECKEVVKQMPENCKLNFVVNVKREGEDKYYKKEINEIFKVIPQSLINEADEILKENPNTLYVSEWYRKSSKTNRLHKKAETFDVAEEFAKKIVEDNKHAFSGHTDMAKLENNAYSMFLMDNASIKEILDEAKKIVSELDNDKDKKLEDADLYFGMKDRALLAEKVLEEKTKQEKQSSKTKAVKKQAEKVLTLKEAIGKDESEFKNMEDIVDYMNHLPLNANKSSWTVEGFGGNSIDVENLSNGEKATIKLKKNFNSRYATRQNKLFKSATIKHENGVYNVYSESGKCLGKGYKTKEEAEKRLKQVEYFKNKKSSLSTKPYFQTSKEMVKDALDLWHSRQNLYNKKYNTDEELGEAEIEQKNKEYNFLIKWNYEYGDFMNTNNDILYKLITNQISIEQAVEKINAFFEQVYNYDPLNPHKKKASFPNKRTSLKQVVISKMAKIKK